MKIRKIEACRSCKSSILVHLFELGSLFISDFPKTTNRGDRSPLNLVQCSNCGLVQLEHTVDRDELFRHFWYLSSSSKTMPTALAEVAESALAIAKPEIGDLVLDIGCNDGTLLQNYPKTLDRVGFEPALNMAEYASKNDGGTIINDYFTEQGYRRKMGPKNARIITTVAMFYDLDEPAKFVQEISRILSIDGVWVDQQNYLGDMLRNNCYDNILHEHLCYYSQDSFTELLNEAGLELFKTIPNTVNGGSVRFYIGHKGQFKQDMVLDERGSALRGQTAYIEFYQRIRKEADRLHELIQGIVDDHQTVYAYGCGTRGNTILQFSKLDNKLISKGCDANAEKWGRYTVGTNIPIISKQQARREKPDYFLVLPHHFRNEIVKAEEEYLREGGNLIFPLPKLEVVPS